MTDVICQTTCHYEFHQLGQVKYFVLKEIVPTQPVGATNRWWIWLCQNKRKIKIATCSLHSEIIKQVASIDTQEDLLEQEKTDEYFRRENRQIAIIAAFAFYESGRRIVWSKERDSTKMVPGWSTRRI